jgi:hypothetical protein
MQRGDEKKPPAFAEGSFTNEDSSDATPYALPLWELEYHE